MTLCFFEILSLKAFFVELVVFIAIIVCGLNIHHIVWYWKQSGQPYKSRLHYLCVRKVGISCAIWSIALIGKLVAFYCGYNLFIMEIASVDVYQACVLGLTDYFTLIVPYYSVIDSEFIQVFWCKHLQPEMQQVSSEVNQDEENPNELRFDNIGESAAKLK